jgi:hypothetical protein
MNFFCRLLGHTWVPVTDNPKITWSTGEDMLVLHAKATAPTRFFDECARCRERREVAPPRIKSAQAPSPEIKSAAGA